MSGGLGEFINDLHLAIKTTANKRDEVIINEHHQSTNGIDEIEFLTENYQTCLENWSVSLREGGHGVYLAVTVNKRDQVMINGNY